MYVTSMLIDGFKSYGRRTEVKGFDPLFNAITGLNGSGKSNILDGICFVLGITNLSHVRATNLQELVYKNGQAGVTRAIVSITFDNRDKAHSPLGYEQYDEITITRQVVVGGRNKYAINGVSVQNNRVQDMFRSVKLNVNNPHFLIMQGRITKVLNMKPPEILSMVEEAAGTRLYESKKQLAVKTIDKKDAKLKEIANIVDEEISPTMTRLKEERAVYLEFQKVQREYEHLKKFCVAFKFVSMQERCGKLKDDQTALSTSLQNANNLIDQCHQKTHQLDSDITRLQAQRDAESGGQLKTLEEALEENVKTDARASATLKGTGDSIKTEQKRQASLTKNLHDDETALQRKETEMAGVQGEFDRLRGADQQHSEALQAARSRFQTLSAGVAADGDAHSATLAQQLMDTRRAVSEAQTAGKQADMRLKQARQQLQQQQKQLRTTAADHAAQQKQLQRTQADVQRLEKAVSELGYDEHHVEHLQQQHGQLNTQLAGVRDQIDVVDSKFPQLAFDYRDPEPNFDRSSIHGTVGKLFQLERAEAATALEVTAGGRLYNVVVSNEVVGKKLLERGHLQKRVTFIPLNQIIGRTIDADTVRHAQKLVGKDNVCTALSCIRYQPEVHKAMEWVFGSTLVCRDLDCAKKVAFDARIQRRAVTLDGDIVDPAGTLTGGARTSRFSVLAELHAVSAAHERQRQLQDQLTAITKQLSQLGTQARSYTDLSQQLEEGRHKLQLLNERVQQSSHCQLQQQLDQLTQQIDELERQLAESVTAEKNGQQLVQQLEEQLQNQTAVRDQQLRHAEQQLRTCEQTAQQARTDWQTRQEDEERMRLEIADLRAAVVSTQEQLASCADCLQQLAAQLTHNQQAAQQAKVALAEAKAALKRHKEVLNSQNREIAELTTSKESLAHTVKQQRLEIMQLQHQADKLSSDLADSIERVRCMREEHEWIGADERFFGQSGTAYDFAANDAGEASRRIAKLDEQRAKLSKNVNMRAIKMLGQAEEQYKDLMSKKRIVENDKANIENVIHELDEKKNETLKRAWQRVNKDFGSIFSTLLPGTSAKLQPLEGRSVLDGLEVRVAFGGVWKESLAELSGGQRSLVALSLILALLLFKPAPIYILDEVDAALDLSHTQNIGTMLRTHFKHSQFIVVSLKDGMFNNANVLFKTKFVDGMSTVARFTQHVPPPSKS